MKKRERLIDEIGYIDEKYVEEAGKTTPRVKFGAKFVAFAACIAIVVCGAGLWLFLPFATEPADVTGYEGSEYYPIIERLNEVLYEEPEHKNNFDSLISQLPTLGGTNDGAMQPDYAPGDPGDAGEYVEITDNQVEGIIEADKIKRSDSHIFYLDGDVIKAYEIKGEESELCGSYKIVAPKDLRYYSTKPIEMYLSKDCKTLCLLIPYGTKSEPAMIDVLAINVENPENMSERARTTLVGSFSTSRYFGERLMLLYSYRPKNDPDFSNEADFIPQIDTGAGYESIPFDSIIYPDKLSTPTYTVSLMLDFDTLSLVDSTAFLSYSTTIYVSGGTVYATRGYTEISDGGSVAIRQTVTEITMVDYTENGFSHRGSVTVDGYLKDQYSLDEHNGILRAVTTTNADVIYSSTEDGRLNAAPDFIPEALIGTSANLYCIDLSTLQTVGSVIGFAPRGETVRSVRFDGDMAYVCTAVQLKDPVFFFDLSNVAEITYTETGTIEGFSTSLIQLSDGFLLGIGVGDTGSELKIEVYEEMAGSVRSVDKYVLSATFYSTEYKSYYINREENLIGLGITEGKYRDEYLLLHFDGYGLRELLRVPLKGENYAKRGVYIDGCFYTFGAGDFGVYRLHADDA